MADAVEKQSIPLGRFAERGETGLTQYAGTIQEELLPRLTGNQARLIYREMMDNDPIVGAMLFTVDMLLRNMSWRVEPWSAEAQDEERAEFLREVQEDMSHTWEDFISEVFTFLPFGWSFFEVVYKRRLGFTRDSARRSKFNDGRVGVRKLAIRSQESLDHWEFDKAGGVQAMVQRIPTTGQVIELPIERGLLFRTMLRKGNPEGRAFAPEMPLPTPDGWRTIDDLAVGDKVFDDEGRIRYVVGRQDWERRPCAEVQFRDGTTIIADSNHLWHTRSVYERSKGLSGRARTTEQIAKTLTRQSGKVMNHAIPWHGPLDYPRQEVPLDPYYFGLWLGDGISRSSDIACHADDAIEIATAIMEAGYSARVEENGPVGGQGRLIRTYGTQPYDSTGPQYQLRRLGVLSNKHVPDCYLRGSIAQRRALLAGLMDSDGTVDDWGRCAFTNVNRQLTESVAELVRSLGMTVKIRPRRPGPTRPSTSWIVAFTPNWNPFHLSRKAERWLPRKRYLAHYISAVRPVAKRRTVCIEVDSPSHLFLVGKNMVPTHNSALRNAYRPWYFKKRVEEIEAVGIERDLAGLPVAYAPAHWFHADASGADSALLTELKFILRNIRKNEQGALAIPMVFDKNNNQLVKIELMSTGGRRQIETNEIIERYSRHIAMTSLADVILMGHEQVGSYALASSKTNLFSTALGAYSQGTQEVLNRHLVPRIAVLNGWPLDRLPRWEHGDIESVDLKELGAFIEQMAGAGAKLFAGEFGITLLNHILEQASLPTMPEDTEPEEIQPPPLAILPPSPVAEEDLDGAP